MKIFKNEKGFTTIVLVLILGLILLASSIMLINSTLSKGTILAEEKASDYLLIACDSLLENILLYIKESPKYLKNSLSDSNSKLSLGIRQILQNINDENKIKKTSSLYALSLLLEQINGGETINLASSNDPYNAIGANFSEYSVSTKTPGSFWDIQDNVSTFLYDIKTRKFYKAVYQNNNGEYKLIEGEINIKPDTLIQEEFTSNTFQISQLDPDFNKNYRWIILRHNTQYYDDGTNNGEFQIRVTGYYLSDPTRVRTIYHIAKMGSLLASIINDYTNTVTPPAFTHAVWTGRGLTINGALYIYSGNISPNGTYTPVYNGGDVYVDGNATLHGAPQIYGSLITSQPQEANPITITGAPLIQNGIQYGIKETLPEIPLPLRDQIRDIAQRSGVIHNGSLTTYSNYNLVVNGGSYNGTNVPYYINGNLTLNATGNVKINSTSTNPPVGLYINGDLNFNGDCTIEFTSPGVIWVDGNITFNGIVRIKGSGTIISTKKITFNGAQGIRYVDDKSISALVSLGQGADGGITVNGSVVYHGLMYAPYSNITFNGESTIFGSVVAGGYGNTQGVTFNGSQNIVYDNRLSSGFNPPPLLGEPQKLIEFAYSYSSDKRVLRERWSEVIEKRVNPDFIKTLNPKVVINN